MSSISTTKMFVMLLRRDLVLAFRRRADMIYPLLFFVLVS